MRTFFDVLHGSSIVVTRYPYMHRRKMLPLFFFLFLVWMNADGQTMDTIRFMSYNLLNYPAAGTNFVSDTTTRHPHYRTILNATNPDILVVQEMNSQTGMNVFLSNVLNATNVTYSAGPFIDGYDTDNGLFYKTSKFHSVTNSAILTELRNISEFKLVHTLSGDTIRIYSVHLKASSGASNEAQRAREVDSLRKVTNALPPGTNFIVCGDFNIYGSTELCYQKLQQVIPGNEGYFIDPITMINTWNQAAYSAHHTQSPRIRAFGGGSTGGMDDRFDLHMYSNAIGQAGGITYVPNSQIPYGNDGNLYNDSINKPSNSAVSPAIANALHNAADHIPVISLFTVEYNGVSIPTDFGVQALLNPQTPMCGNANQSMSVQVKNHGALAVDFSATYLQVVLEVTSPSFGIQTFTETINSGSLGAGANLIVNFSNLVDMSASGTYSFRSYTLQANDANHLNDTLPAVTINVTSSASAIISPPGPVSMCNGDSVTLTASPGISYLWSNNETTPSITVMDTGNYSVQVTITGGCSSSSGSVAVSFVSPPVNGLVFYESMGTVSATTSIDTHEANNGFDNDGFTMSGTADVRNTAISSGYSGVSGGANVFFTSSGKTFVISGINTTGMSNLQLSHGMYKNGNAANGTELLVEISTNGVDYTPLSVSPLPTGTGTSTWHYRTVSGTIPSVSSLSIRFNHSSGTTQYRIDDITLSGTGSSASILAGGPTTFCLGDSVVLSASTGNRYLWSTGATSPDITVYSSGSYSVTVDCSPSPVTNVVVNNCQDVTLNLKALIQGFYIGNQLMSPVLDPVNYPGICDSITVELAEAVSPYTTVYSQKSVLETNGMGSFVFPASVLNNSYYIVLKHRNALETWSSIPLFFNSTSLLYDFTISAGKAFGNNLADMDGEFCLYSGDITNGTTLGVQDGIIDSLDFDTLENALSQFITGYSIYDLNGDWILESADFSLIGSNAGLGFFVMKP